MCIRDSANLVASTAQGLGQAEHLPLDPTGHAEAVGTDQALSLIHISEPTRPY